AVRRALPAHQGRSRRIDAQRRHVHLPRRVRAPAVRIRGGRRCRAVRRRLHREPGAQPHSRHREGPVTITTPAARVRRGLLYATLIALVVVFIAPLVWAISGSFKGRGDIFETPPRLIPDPIT